MLTKTDGEVTSKSFDSMFGLIEYAKSEGFESDDCVAIKGRKIDT